MLGIDTYQVNPAKLRYLFLNPVGVETPKVTVRIYRQSQIAHGLENILKLILRQNPR